MKKIIVDEKNHIAYQLIGDIYYPKEYVQLLKDKDFHNQLFILNCYCEQYYQKRLI